MFDDLARMNLLWGAPDWAWPAIAIAAVLALLVLWAYLTSDATGTIRVICGLLKLAAIVLLAVCLLQPMRSGTRPRPQANLLPIVVDNSQSMRIKGDSGDESRHERVMALVDQNASWRTRLAQSFDVRPYAFDSRLQNLDDFDSLQADGEMSSLAGSLQSLAERFAERPVAGLVLMSDGNLTDSPGDDFDWKSLGFPVYPVVSASEPELEDIRIVDVSVRQTDFESAPTTVTVSYDSVGFDGQMIVARLTDSSGKLIEEQSQENSDGELDQVTFRFRPEKSGVSFHTVSVKADSGAPAEATDVNNQRVVAVDRDAGPYRVLYVAGRPNWEFKFLRRALQEEAEVQLVGLIRIAKQEPKFSFRDNSVSDSNPLFSGLGDGEEEAAEQYDEPVILRLGVREEEELSDGFPKTADELFAYHGVILDDLETQFFTQDQLVMLRSFVSSRGGGLLLLGGTESFAGKDFANSPLGELSPVYPRRGEGDVVEGPYRIELTREGLLQPWTRLRETEQAEFSRLDSMPEFATMNMVGQPKPGAAQLATMRGEDDQQIPALVAQRFGRGRTAAIMLGDLWRWSMRRSTPQHDTAPHGSESSAPSDQDDPAQAWRQLTRWLVNDVPRRAELELESDDNFQSVTIIARARNESYLPLDNATVELKITPPNGESFSLTAEMDESEQGAYKATCWSQESGGYRVEAVITAADGAEVGKTVAGWTAQPAATELANLTTNRTLLERIARETGGELVVDSDLDRFAADMPTRKVPVSESWVYPIWHRPWVMITAMLCLCGEWGLRRWKGLA
jgi:uncharacterized membrane protein